MKARWFAVITLLFTVAVFTTGCPRRPAVSLNVNSVTLNIGQSLVLEAASTDSADAPFAWTVGNPAVAALDAATGTAVRVTAVGAGATTVTVTGAASGARAVATISVPTPVVEEPPAQVAVTPISAVLEVGNTLPLQATSTDTDDTTFNWTVANGAVASLNSNEGANVVLTALSAGVTVVTATGNVSGVSATAAVSVLASGDIGVTPLVPAGLKVTITGVTIPADLRPEVRLVLTNNRGDKIPRVEITDARFIIARLDEAPAEGRSAQYISYNSATVASSGRPSALQATYDGARLAGLTDNGDGTMTYKFRTALPADYSRTATHAVGWQFSRTSALDGLVYPSNDAYEFRPDGGAVSMTREIVDTATCNECHTRLQAHGSRREIRLCILCHNPGSTDPDTGNTVDMPVMIHKIHHGEELPSVQAGTPYQIIGFGGSVHDYSEVVFPQDIRNCTACHKEEAKSGQEAAWLTNPTRAACGSCHDRTWFGSPTETPEGFINHSVEFEQSDDRLCAACHTPEAPGYAPIREAHLTLEERPEAPGLHLEITEVAANDENGTLQIKFTAQYGDGTPIADLTGNPQIGAVVAWPASEYQNYRSETIRSTGATTGTLASTTSPTGEYTYTFRNTLPLDPGMTFGLAMTGRVTFQLNGANTTQGLDDNSLTFFTLDGSAPVPRRKVVDDALCAKCHGGTIRAHGEQRVGVDTCVMCHNTVTTDVSRRPADQMPPVTVNFKDMLHRVHTGEELQDDYTIYGFGGAAFNANHVLFPGLRQQCSICHGSHSVDVPLAPEAAPTVVSLNGEVLSTTLPERAACTTCHDSLLVDIHAVLNTEADLSIETCAVCHGAGADFAVAAMHKLAP